MTPPQLPIYGTVASEVVARAERMVADHKGLGDILTWGARATPPRKPEDVDTQDEYTHDVIMRFEDGVYLAYDVT